MGWSALGTLKKIQPCTKQQWWDACMEEIRLGGGAMFTYDLDSVLDDYIEAGCMTYVFNTELLCITDNIDKRLYELHAVYDERALAREARKDKQKNEFSQWVDGIQLDQIKAKLRQHMEEDVCGNDGYIIWTTLWELLSEDD